MRRLASRRTIALTMGGVVLLAYVALVGLRVLYPLAYESQILTLAEAHDLDPALLAAVVRCESRFRAAAVSARGAVGLMQIMPETGAWIAEQIPISGYSTDRLVEPELNLRLGCWYLRSLLERFDTRDEALAAYNAGPTHAERWGRGDGSIFPETRTFIDRVNASLPVYDAYFSARWLLRITPSLLL